MHSPSHYSSSLLHFTEQQICPLCFLNNSSVFFLYFKKWTWIEYIYQCIKLTGHRLRVCCILTLIPIQELTLLSVPSSFPPALSTHADSTHCDLWRPCWIFHTISLHSSGCTSAASQYVAIIGPVVGAESKAINPFLLLFAPWLAVTGCSVIGQERTCPLHFTLISLQLQTLIPARLRIPLLLPISSQSLFPVLPLPPVSSPPSPCWTNL